MSCLPWTPDQSFGEILFQVLQYRTNQVSDIPRHPTQLCKQDFWTSPTSYIISSTKILHINSSTKILNFPVDLQKKMYRRCKLSFTKLFKIRTFPLTRRRLIEKWHSTVIRTGCQITTSNSAILQSNEENSRVRWYFAWTSLPWKSWQMKGNKAHGDLFNRHLRPPPEGGGGWIEWLQQGA